MEWQTMSWKEREQYRKDMDEKYGPTKVIAIGGMPVYFKDAYPVDINMFLSSLADYQERVKINN